MLFLALKKLQRLTGGSVQSNGKQSGSTGSNGLIVEIKIRIMDGSRMSFIFHTESEQTTGFCEKHK